MNKFIASIALVLVSIVCIAQDTKSHVSMNLYGGTKNTVGFQITGGKNVILGLGVGMYYGESYVGEDFTTIFHWTKYPQDVYQHITAPHTSIYAIAGRKITDKLAVQINTGIWTKQTYHNAVDRTGILGPRGFYYTTEPAGINVLLGGQITYEVNKIGALVGYDTFSGPKFGLTYTF